LSEREEIDNNELNVAHKGRDPKLKLRHKSSDVELKAWAKDLLSGMQSVSELLDRDKEDTPYSDALNRQMEKVLHSELTPSARMLDEMRETKEGFYHFAKRMSQKHNQYFTKLRLAKEKEQFFDKAVAESLAKQLSIEMADTQSLDDYLENYFKQR